MSAYSPLLASILAAAIAACAAEPSPPPEKTKLPGPPATASWISTVSPTPVSAETPTATPTSTVSPAPTASAGPTSVGSFASSNRLTARPAGSVPGAPLGYLEYLPPGYGDGVARPLLLFLHGSEQSGNGSKRQLQRLTATAIPGLMARDAWPANRSFIVLVPQHRLRVGSYCTQPDEVARFLRFALAQYNVDSSRVYLTGLSCGAIGAWAYLGLHTDQLVAAAVLIAGDGRAAFREAGCDLGRVAIWAIHGAADRVVDVRGSRVPIRRLNACTNPPPVDARLTTLPGVGHHAWNPVYDMTLGFDIYGWLLQHSNPGG